MFFDWHETSWSSCNDRCLTIRLVKQAACFCAVTQTLLLYKKLECDQCQTAHEGDVYWAEPVCSNFGGHSNISYMKLFICYTHE